MKTCAKCNLSYDDDKKFCKKCGDPLTSEYQIDPKNVGKKTVLEDRLKVDPLNIELLHEYAQFLFNNLLFKDTITVTYKILAINEIDGAARELLYKSYYKLNMLKEASEIGKQLLKERPTDIFILGSLAKISRKLGNYDKATEYYDGILSIQPSNTTALYNKALILLEKNQFGKAIEIFKRLYQEGHNDRITTIYAGIYYALNADYKTAIDLLVPILNDRDTNRKELDNNRGFLYLCYSLSQSSANILEVSQWFSKIDFEVLKNDHHQLDEQTAIKVVEFIIKHELNEINQSFDANYRIKAQIESNLPYGYFTTNSNPMLADIWFAVGNKQIELKLLADAINSFQKACDLMPAESKYKEKCSEIEKLLADDARKKNRKINIIIAVIVTCLITIGISIFAYKNFEEKDAYNFAKNRNTFDSYQTYLNKYPDGKYYSEAKQSQEEAFWKKTKELNTSEGYNDFITYYSNSLHIQEARVKKEVALWNEVKKLNSLEGYRKYLSIYPNSKYSNEANDSLLTSMLACTFVMGGTFQMGSNDGGDNEKPIHSVTLKNFFMGKYEVTQALWKAVMGNNPSRFKGDELPVETVSWNEVQIFINKLKAKTGKTYRLPTEPEWEYAARGGKQSHGYKYAGSNNLNDVAWYNEKYDENSNKTTHKVGSKQPNELGLYDMSGNVYEWCSDRYLSYYSVPSSHADMLVIRGGSFIEASQYCRVANRYGHYGDKSRESGTLGFRIAIGSN